MTTAELIAFYNEWTGSGKTAEQVAEKIYKETGSSDILKHYTAAGHGRDVKDDLAKLAVLLTAYSLKIGDKINDIEDNLVDVDATLTQQGYAADAEATGIALEGKIDNVNPTGSGYVALGDGATVLGFESGVAIGEGTRSSSNAAFIAIGRYNHIGSDTDDFVFFALGSGYKHPITEEIVRRNAITVDDNGDAWFAGDIKVGGTSYSDPNSKKLATEDYVDSALASVTTGTFTHQLGVLASSDVVVKQIGNVVYIFGEVSTFELNEATNHVLGTISGVTAPNSMIMLPVISRLGTTLHNGLLKISKENNVITATMYGCDENDSSIMINGFYSV